MSAVILIAVIMCCLAWKAGWLDFRSVDEKLAAIDAELAIADSENAAVFYMKFFAEPNNATVLDDLYLQSPIGYVAPWIDSKHPELATQLQTHGAFIQTLLNISQMPKARFPAYYGPGTDSAGVLMRMLKVTCILSGAAANDLAQGRTDAAYGKYRCQLQLARHLQQQSPTSYKGRGVACETVAFGNISRALMCDGITQEQLRSLEAIVEIPWNQDELDAEITVKVDRLTVRKHWLIQRKEGPRLPLALRFNLWRRRSSQRLRSQRLRQISLRLEATRRATSILIALVRCKEDTGRWPETLEQIEPKLPQQMLADPQNSGPFVYKRDGDGFVLYSKGPNGIDEGGSSSRPADDWPVWPPPPATSPFGH
jgi:hypothetical protein